MIRPLFLALLLGMGAAFADDAMQPPLTTTPTSSAPTDRQLIERRNRPRRDIASARAGGGSKSSIALISSSVALNTHHEYVVEKQQQIPIHGNAFPVPNSQCATYPPTQVTACVTLGDRVLHVEGWVDGKNAMGHGAVALPDSNFPNCRTYNFTGAARDHHSIPGDGLVCSDATIVGHIKITARQ